MAMTQKSHIICLLSFGLLSAVVGVIIFVIFPIIMRNQLEKKLVLTKGTQSYQFWEKIPIPIYIKFYFFNITNPGEVYDNVNKPELEEVGPYVFRESREKVDISWHLNGTMTYRQVKKWFYRPDLTNGSLDDKINTINVPMMTAASMASNRDELFRIAVSALFFKTGSTWFIKKSVKELLFEGYEDQLIDEVKDFVRLPFDKFGWFYKRNGTDDGEMSIFIGKPDINNIDEIRTWNNKSSVDAYDAPCNKLNGSAGDLWPPFRKEGGKIGMVIPDICRTLHFSYLGKRTVQDLTGYRYWADDTELDNGYKNPSNKCFCTGNNCLPPGGLNVSRCKFDAPAVVSYPHFLFADASYSQGLIGLQPDPQKHEMYIDLEPEMGIPLNVAARMQINVILDKVHGIPQFSNVTKRTFYPVFWFSETATIDNDMAYQLKLIVQIFPTIAHFSSYFLVALGVFLAMTALLKTILLKRKDVRRNYRLEDSK